MLNYGRFVYDTYWAGVHIVVLSSPLNIYTGRKWGHN